MKTSIFNYLIICLLLISCGAKAERSVKKMYKSYPVSQVAKMSLNNKYGNILIDNSRKDSVVVAIEIWVEGTSSRSKSMLDDINVTIQQNGKEVQVETNIENNVHFNQEFNVNYHISVPADRDLTVAQKYGSVNMENLTGKGLFDIKYSELTAKNLLSPELSIDLAYGKATIESSKNMNLSIRYSKLFLNNGADLKIDSRYSALNVGVCKDVTLDSRYDDNSFKSANSFTSNSMYTSNEIGQLLSQLTLENGYGNLTVKSIPADFKSIIITNKYAAIKLGIAANASYKLDGTVKYCDLKHPAGRQLNKSKTDYSYEVRGVVGPSDLAKGEVRIDSSYGSVNLIP